MKTIKKVIAAINGIAVDQQAIINELEEMNDFSFLESPKTVDLFTEIMEEETWEILEFLLSKLTPSAPTPLTHLDEPLLSQAILLYQSFSSESYIESFGDKAEQQRNDMKKVIEMVLACPNYNVNEPDVNFDTALHLAAAQPSTNWVVEKLLQRSGLQSAALNVYNDVFLSPLGTAKQHGNMEAFNMIACKKRQLPVTPKDKEIGVKTEETSEGLTVISIE